MKESRIGDPTTLIMIDEVDTGGSCWVPMAGHERIRVQAIQSKTHKPA
jgi:hypothetical protein